MKSITTLIALSFAFVFSLALAGCNTMHGAGQDIQKAGSSIENAADKKKSD